MRVCRLGAECFFVVCVWGRLCENKCVGVKCEWYKVEHLVMLHMTVIETHTHTSPETQLSIMYRLFVQQITNIFMTIHLIMMQRKIHYISALQLSKPWSFKDTVSGAVHCTESQYIQPIRLVNSTLTFRELAMVLKSITQPLRPAENNPSSDFIVALPTTSLAVSFAPNQYYAGLYSYSL
jgi:hypothetical protein